MDRKSAFVVILLIGGTILPACRGGRTTILRASAKHAPAIVRVYYRLSRLGGPQSSAEISFTTAVGEIHETIQRFPLDLGTGSVGWESRVYELPAGMEVTLATQVPTASTRGNCSARSKPSDKASY